MSVSYHVIGRAIRKARLNAHLTQEELSDKIGLSQLHLGRLERGERRTSLDQISEIADILNVSAYSLIKGSLPPNHEVFPPMDNETVQFIKQLKLISDGCSPKALSLMQTICQAIADSDKFPNIKDDAQMQQWK